MKYRILTNGSRFVVERKWLNLVWLVVRRSVATGNGYRMLPAYFDTADEARNYIDKLHSEKEDKQKNKRWHVIGVIKN